jgi:ATP-dependent helicase/nuclease subunit B
VGVRFLIGRAGTGKSTQCAEQIRAAMASDPLGGSLFWITPEQATFTAERLLLTGGRGQGAVRGSFRAQVVSFQRLALLIARQLRLIGGAGGAGKNARPMEDLSRIVLLEEMVMERKGELQIFAAVADRPGFIEKLDTTLRELRQHGQTGASLRETVSKAGVDVVTFRKVSDLALLLDAWEGVVERVEAWDFERVMHRAALEADKAPLVTGGDGARVWVDGFSALSALEIRLLVALGLHAADVTITLQADPESPGMKSLRGTTSEAIDAGVFARTERLHRRLIDAFRKHHVEIVGTEFLRKAHRFAVPALGRLEADLFREGERAEPRKKSDTRGPVATTLFSALEGAGPEVPEGLEIWECSDPETEVRVAAQAIRDMVTVSPGQKSPPLRYRQVGVIVPDLDGYQDAVRRIFTEHRIPHFIDQRRSIAHHPLVELLRSIVAIATGRWDQDELLLYLKTGLAGVAEGDVALVENYVLAHGIDHVQWSSEWRWFAPNQKEDEEVVVPEEAREMLERVNGVRKKVWGDLRAWMEVAESKMPVAASDYARGLKAMLDRLRVEAQVEEWVRLAREGAEARDVELAQVHEQAWRQIVELLEMLEQLLANRERTLEQFEKLLATALETMTLGLIPPTVDQVLVSSVTRSRVPELKVAFVIGAVEGQFPKVLSEDPILSDLQREVINATSPFPIGEGSDRQLIEMPFFDYAALTRASHRLVVSYPLADRQGRAVAKSRYIARIRDLFSMEEGAVPQIIERKLDAGSRMDVEHIGTLDDLLTGVVSWARNEIRRRRETLEAPEGGVVPEQGPSLAPLYNWLANASNPAIQAARELVWSSIRDRPAPVLATDLARRFYPPEKHLRLSVSQLEKFAGCPLQYFMHYTLGLRTRAMLELDTLHLGILYHRILERLYSHVIEGTLKWPDCETHTLRKVLETEVDAACEQLHEELAERTPAYDSMRVRTKRTLGIVLEGQRRRACQGDLRPVGVEVTFGGPTKVEEGRPRRKDFALKVLEIKTPKGRVVELNGKIDRVDAAHEGKGRQVGVVDYKSSSSKSLDLAWVYYGLSLQLPVYAVVMEDLAKREPIAALYVPLGIKRETVKRPADVPLMPGPDSDEFYQKSEPRGVVDEAGASHLDHTVGPHEDSGGKSDWYKIGYNKDGGVPKTGDMLEHADFTMMLNYVRWKIGTMTDNLMEGQISPVPFRDRKQIPCDECDFASLCPFDRANGTFRAVPRMKRDDALAAMRSAVGGEATE